MNQFFLNIVDYLLYSFGKVVKIPAQTWGKIILLIC